MAADPIEVVEAPHRRFNIGRPRTGVEIEELIQEMLDQLEDDNEAHHEAQLAAAHAEAAYRKEHAYHFLNTVVRTDTGRTAYAAFHASDLFEERKVTAAEAVAAQELCRNRREQLAALRSLLVSARTAEHGT